MLLRRVVGDSMWPALKPGRIVIAIRTTTRARIGDVIIVRHDGLEKIKRVTDVDIDKVYVEGDNKPYSTDSRHFGWVDITHIQGKVIWPRTKPIKTPTLSSPK